MNLLCSWAASLDDMYIVVFKGSSENLYCEDSRDG